MPAKLTRQHFQFFADCIKDAISAPAYSGFDLYAEADRDVLRRFAASTATLLETTNPRFDRKRFLDACGV
jgi:hypothetical protein